MTPARRKILSRIKRGTAKKNHFGIKKLLAVVVTVSAIFVFIKTQTRFWNGRDKLSVAISAQDRLVVSTFDPETSEITNVYIPGDTQVDSARQLGTFRVKNIRKLGDNEKIGGVLLSETITKNFKFPVTAWASESALAFSTSEPGQIFKAIVSPFETNLGMGDKLALALFSLRVKNTNRVEIDLTNTAFIKKTKLIDGEEGYIISGQIPQGLAAVFADSHISEEALRVVIKNETGESSDPTAVAQILEVLGAKVASLVKGEMEDYDCQVLGESREITKKVAQILSCEIISGLPEGNFNLEVRLGKGFAERF